MATKGVDKRGASQPLPPTEEGKLSSPRNKTALSKGVASGTRTTKSARAAEGHVPNDETAQVLRDVQEGKNLLHYESLEEMFKDLGI